MTSRQYLLDYYPDAMQEYAEAVAEAAIEWYRSWGDHPDLVTIPYASIAAAAEQETP